MKKIGDYLMKESQWASFSHFIYKFCILQLQIGEFYGIISMEILKMNTCLRYYFHRNGAFIFVFLALSLSVEKIFSVFYSVIMQNICMFM